MILILFLALILSIHVYAQDSQHDHGKMHEGNNHHSGRHNGDIHGDDHGHITHSSSSLNYCLT